MWPADEATLQTWFERNRAKYDEPVDPVLLARDEPIPCGLQGASSLPFTLTRWADGRLTLS